LGIPSSVNPSDTYRRHGPPIVGEVGPAAAVSRDIPNLGPRVSMRRREFAEFGSGRRLAKAADQLAVMVDNARESSSH
jgi:hypothetical protein